MGRSGLSPGEARCVQLRSSKEEPASEDCGFWRLEIQQVSPACRYKAA